MKTLLRSVFAGSVQDNQKLLLENYSSMDASGLGFDTLEDRAIWQYIKDFVVAHQHLPNLHTIRTHFERVQEMEVVDKLEHVATLRPRFRGDFYSHLENKAEDRRRRLATTILKDAGGIITTGITVKEGKTERILRGPVDAMRYVMDKAHDIVTPTTGARLSGEITKDGEDFKREYERVESDPLAGIGQYSGLQQMDEALRGAKRYELWTHAAFTGGLKSTLMLNWAYNQAIWYNHDVLIFSLEMPYTQCRRILYAMHSGHEKFKDIHEAIPYMHIRDGEMTPDEKDFLFKHVVPDLNTNSDYGAIHIEVADPEKADFTVADLRAKAELIYSKNPFSVLFVDHALLMSPRKWVPSTTERLNEVIRDCKKLAMGFNKGMGLAVFLLFQISREGYKAAEKNGGKYNLTHLSYANEAERSSDIVTATWIDDDMRKKGQVMVQCLKSRDQEPFENFRCAVSWPTRRMTTLLDPFVEDIQQAGQAVDGDVLEME